MKHVPSAWVPMSVALLTTTALLTACKPALVAFDPDGVLDATIRYTEFGVPHIEAENLESLAYGVGFAFARDNVCVLADLVVRANSQRARYFGPDLVAGSGDSQHLISDFGYLGLDIRQQAESGLAGMSDNSRAMLSGYAKGYNKYLQDTGISNIDPVCAGQPWVRSITDIDMLTALLGIALMPGSAQFGAAMFVATPPGTSYLPVPSTVLTHAAAAKTAALPPALASHITVTLPEKNALELGSNGWALGKKKTESGKGMLLANPHFPHTGSLRFWQFHTTIPGVLNVMGASLAGAPGMVNIGFNDDLAWTHTYSTAEHVVAYQLTLDPNDTAGMTYLVDGVAKPIQNKTFTIDVKVGPDTVMPFQKTMYYSEFGPVFVVPNLLPWGTNAYGQFSAFSIKDANRNNFDLIDHWLAMDLACNMSDFQQAFKDYDGVVFNNTVAVDKTGNTFYIDDSTVPHLSDTAETALTTDPTLQQLRQMTGFSILPGNSAVFDFTESVPYEKAPKLTRKDFVQNSNDSYWLANPAQPITGVSVLYGKTNNEQSYRSRLSQKMLQDSAGSDAKFSQAEVEAALFSQRTLLGEEIRDDLLAQCAAQGSTPVLVSGVGVDISVGCNALAQWDGLTTKESKAAHLFREFAQQFALAPQWQIPFDPNSPTTTPNTFSANSVTLQQFAKAVLNVNAAGIALDAPLGNVQFVERTQPDGTPTGEKLPWAGGNNIEGGFNVFRPVFSNDGSLIPRHVYAPLPGTQLSAEGQGYHIAYGSSWMMTVAFNSRGPVARGLMTMSQSTNLDSPHFLDQTRLYSETPALHDLPFHEEDVAEHTLSTLVINSGL